MKVIVLLTGVLGACTAASTRVVPQRCPSSGIDSASLVPIADQPKPIELFTPPLPIPTAVAGHRSTIRVVIDPLGSVMPDSIMVCGVSDEAYARRIADLVAGVRFQPRRVGGHPVVSPALLVYSF